LEEIQRAITPGTRLVVVTNPGNPTGHVLSNEVRKAILERVQAAGAWLLCDEVYQGAERNGVTTPSFWGSYDKLVVVNGLSKAYGLPGLRIGWIVAPKQFIGDVWAHQDYTVIGPSPASDFLARCAIKARTKILERTRGILKANFPVVDAWLKTFDGFFEWLPSEAGAICCVRYRGGPKTLDLVEQIRAKQSVLLVPGEHFGMPSGYLRLGFGNERPELERALAETKAGLKAAIRD
jgi:aspartate/methionine/tyrosine aminotransferase